MTRLSIIICVHNAADYAEICLESVQRHTAMPYELIVVNDGSGAETTRLLQRWVKDHAQARLIHHATALGYTCAANAGLRAACGEYAVLLNSDTIVSPGWAERLLACAESDPAIGIVGPLSNAATYQSVPEVFADDGRWKQNILPGDVTVSAMAETVARASAQTYPRLPVVNGFCFCIKRRVIETIGLFDEDTFPQGYGEENDYCLRAADAGFAIAVADDAYVYHAVSRSFGPRARERLTRAAHHAIRRKYSDERLNAVDRALRNHEGMQAVRERILAAEHAPPHATGFAAPNRSRSVLFLLPDCEALAGGTQMVMDLARGLARLGVPVAVAIKESARYDFERAYPADARHLFAYSRDSELLNHAVHYRVAVATIFHSIRQLKQIVARHPSILPCYFVQDYEPLFYDDAPHHRELALASYTLLPQARLLTPSPWVAAILSEQHGVQAEVIPGCYEPQLFFPDFDRAPQPIAIAAMLRPATPRRAPERTARLLLALKQRFGDGLSIHTFGCSDDALQQAGLQLPGVQHHGVLNRRDMAGLLRASDLFIDASDFQAFGRTALEAMACGCAVIAPRAGGVRAFATDGESILLVDSADEAALFEAAASLIESPEAMASLQQAAWKQAMPCTPERSAAFFLAALSAPEATALPSTHRERPAHRAG